MHDYSKHKSSAKIDNRLALLVGLGQVFRSPLTSLVFILVFSFSLFLVIISYMFWANTDQIDDKWNESAKITAYLKKNISSHVANGLVERIRLEHGVSKAELIDREEGIKKFVKNSLLNNLLSSFKKNPLPDVIVIQPKIRVMPEVAIRSFIEELEAYPEIETVKVDLEWIARSYDLLNLISGFSLSLVFIFAINALFLICGIGYLLSQLFISISGTTRDVLQLQFAWYGLISGLLAISFVLLFLSILCGYGVCLSGFKLGGWFVVLFTSIFLSFFSARFAVHLYNHRVH